MIPPLARRRFLALLPASPALLPFGKSAVAQAWPERTVRLVVPFPSGAGALDIMARLLVHHLAPTLGQPVVIDNRPGGGGIKGAELLIKSPADGYTVLMGNLSLVVNPYLLTGLPYDPVADFVPVTLVNLAPLVLVTHPSLPVNSVAELIAFAKAWPGQLNYGSGGIGSTPFLATELFRSMAGIDVTHVPYRGGAPALADLVGGRLSFMIESVSATLAMVKAGRLKALGVTADHRLPLMPDVPTVSETGLPDYEVVGWNGLFVPRETPSWIVDRLFRDLARILRSPDVRQEMAALGAEPGGNAPREFAAFVRAEAERWGSLIQERGFRPD